MTGAIAGKNSNKNKKVSIANAIRFGSKRGRINIGTDWLLWRPFKIIFVHAKWAHMHMRAALDGCIIPPHNIHRMKNLRSYTFFHPSHTHSRNRYCNDYFTILKWISSAARIFLHDGNPALILRISCRWFEKQHRPLAFYEAQSWFVEFIFLCSRSPAPLLYYIFYVHYITNELWTTTSLSLSLSAVAAGEVFYGKKAAKDLVEWADLYTIIIVHAKCVL